MPIRDDLGMRMKEYYEAIPKTRLMRRTPVAIRLDGRAFHTFTRGFEKPFDEILVTSMQDTMKYLCEEIQGCVFGYTQSDEITLILIDYQTLDTDAWFGWEVQESFQPLRVQPKACARSGIGYRRKRVRAYIQTHILMIMGIRIC